MLSPRCSEWPRTSGFDSECGPSECGPFITHGRGLAALLRWTWHRTHALPCSNVQLVAMPQVAACCNAPSCSLLQCPNLLRRSPSIFGGGARLAGADCSGADPRPAPRRPPRAVVSPRRGEEKGTSMKYTSVQYTSVKYTSMKYMSVQCTSVQYTSVQYTSSWPVQAVGSQARQPGDRAPRTQTAPPTAAAGRRSIENRLITD